MMLGLSLGLGRSGSDGAGGITPPPPDPTVPVNVSPPSISGTPQVDQELAVNGAIWDPAATSNEYQWFVCDTDGNNCGPISGATGSIYVVQGGDVGSTLRVQEIGINVSGSSEPATSEATAVVTPVEPPSNHTAPEVTPSSPNPYDIIYTTDGGWNGNPTSYTYLWEYSSDYGFSWFSSGSIGISESATPGSEPRFYRCIVTATNTGGSVSAVSTTAGPVAPI